MRLLQILRSIRGFFGWKRGWWVSEARKHSYPWCKIVDETACTEARRGSTVRMASETFSPSLLKVTAQHQETESCSSARRWVKKGTDIFTPSLHFHTKHHVSINIDTVCVISIPIYYVSKQKCSDVVYVQLAMSWTYTNDYPYLSM